MAVDCPRGNRVPQTTERDQLDIAIRFVARGGNTRTGERLFACKTSPVCSPAPVRGKARPLRTPADLAHHVRLDYETIRDGLLCAPFGLKGMANRGDFFIVIRRDVSGRDAVEAFVAWLRTEMQRDQKQPLAPRAKSSG